MYSKTIIFNMALNALLLTRNIVDADTDTGTEAQVLRNNWDVSFRQALQDMDLDGTASQVDLELIEEDPNKVWKYSYQYPTDCAIIRRIQSCLRTDNAETMIPRRVSMRNGHKVIFTDEYQAILEYISYNLDISLLSASAGQCVAYRLALNSSPLIVGKGANELRKTLAAQYITAKSEAQEHDRLENTNFEDEVTQSTFVGARLS